ncbi:MAG: hypothetical protein RL648_983, partial [Verrucomicrobiota bacterium]
ALKPIIRPNPQDGIDRRHGASFDLAVEFKSRPLGDPINGSPHSVCVQLPTMTDVVGYEEKDPRVLSSFVAGYPRFFCNPILAALRTNLVEEGLLLDGDALLPDAWAARALCDYGGISRAHIRDHGDFFSVSLRQDPSQAAKAKAFLQHTGSGLSSREAEAILHKRHGWAPFPEDRRDGSRAANDAFVREHLHQIYGTASPQDIALFRSGMNAFFAGFLAISELQAQRGRHLWIQLGWLYVDTVRILEQFNTSGAVPLTIRSVVDLDELEGVLEDVGSEVAGIVGEVPTNPLVETPDLDRLQRLARRFGAALILDPTLASPHNVHVLPFTDLHVNSLTKYAAAEADVMMGALALNSDSPHYAALRDIMPKYGSAPGEGDLARIAAQIPRYAETIRTINATTPVVAEFLENHPAVASVHWAYKQPGAYNYRWLQHHANGPGGIISFVLKDGLNPFYDRCNFAKSPSFGARFTMLCPFMYLAHYDLLQSESGIAHLLSMGLHPELIRLSIGMEPVEHILDELERSL